MQYLVELIVHLFVASYSVEISATALHRDKTHPFLAGEESCPAFGIGERKASDCSAAVT
jgi:hypothetical protein